jgi:hypothetical protein
LDVARRVILGKKCVCDNGERGGEYGNKMYSFHSNGKWLMEFHVSLLIFLLYLKYEINVGIVLHSRTVWSFVVFIY